MRRILIFLSVGLVCVFALSALGMYGLTRGYFESVPEHAQEPEPPALDPSAALPPAAKLESLARTNPIGFLKACLLRYRREVQGYRATLLKQERLNGKLGPWELLGVEFREQPFSVLLTWQSSPAGMADRALYVAGQNGGKALARGKILHLIHHRDPYSADAINASRIALPEFGMAKGTERDFDRMGERRRSRQPEGGILGFPPRAGSRRRAMLRLPADVQSARRRRCRHDRHEL